MSTSSIIGFVVKFRCPSLLGRELHRLVALDVPAAVKGPYLICIIYEFNYFTVDFTKKDIYL